MSNDFVEFHQYYGIKRQFTTRYTPQQNRVVKRKNHTIMYMDQSMMKEKHLPNKYWGDVVTCLVYILNRIPTKSVKYRVPQQAWSGKCRSISHLRIFGCVAYTHVPEEMRRKLDDRSHKCIFVGYSEQYKPYRLYNPITKKYQISIDVVFKEQEAWDGSIDKLVGEEAITPHVEDEEDEQGTHGGLQCPSQPLMTICVEKW